MVLMVEIQAVTFEQTKAMQRYDVIVMHSLSLLVEQRLEGGDELQV